MCHLSAENPELCNFCGFGDKLRWSTGFAFWQLRAMLHLKKTLGVLFHRECTCARHKKMCVSCSSSWGESKCIVYWTFADCAAPCWAFQQTTGVFCLFFFTCNWHTIDREASRLCSLPRRQTSPFLTAFVYEKKARFDWAFG